MSNCVTFRKDLDIVEIVFRRNIDTQDLEESTVNALQLANDRDLTLFLIDISEAGLEAPLVDVYDLADKRYEEAGANRKNRAALVSSSTEKSLKLAEFYQHVCMNRGWMVKVFLSQEKALEWLTSCRRET